MNAIHYYIRLDDFIPFIIIINVWFYFNVCCSFFFSFLILFCLTNKQLAVLWCTCNNSCEGSAVIQSNVNAGSAVKKKFHFNLKAETEKISNTKHFIMQYDAQSCKPAIDNVEEKKHKKHQVTRIFFSFKINNN